MVQEHVMAGKENLKNTAIYSVSYVRVEPNRSARWQHIERYSRRILFTRVMYVCRYISEQKATFGRGPDGARAAAGARGGSTHTAAIPRTRARAPRPCVSNQRARQPTDQLVVFLLL